MPLEFAVPLSRFTSRVGGSLAFYVRPHYTFMKYTITIFILLLFVVGCSKHGSQQQAGRADTVISNGMGQKTVLDQLSKSHVEILSKSPELIRTQWGTNQSQLLDFHFIDDRLTLTTFTNANRSNP
jgi:hypothetical protein